MDAPHECTYMNALKGVWEVPPSVLQLPSQEVHIWCASLEQSAFCLQQLAATLSPDEQERAARFHFEQHRRNFMISRGVLRAILGRYVEVAADRLQFSYGSWGKPALVEEINPGGVYFNLAHSQTLAVYAIAPTPTIGIDIEFIRPMPNSEKLVERWFSTTEKAAFAVLSPDQRQDAFFRCWTRKEAYLKAIGTGLMYSLDYFDVSLAPEEPARILSIHGDNQLAAHWMLQDLHLESGYTGAFAVEGQGWQVKFWQWHSET